ncbi:MAG: ATP-binding cassette domain-containing protein [Nitrospinae bacterium]|nr:ATP-binding cassette domain-containing protein [Nitrospinota bacterium]
MIQAIQLGIHFGKKVLFEDVSFQLNSGNRYGVAGANGSGKSTLLKILAGEMASERGEVRLPSQVKLGFLRQNHFEFEQFRIIDTVLMGKPDLWSALREKESLLLLPAIDEKAGNRLAELEMTIAHEDGYEAESTAAVILNGLGIGTFQHGETMSTLSGGYKLRVLLAQLLFSQPDCLLLDEPNNHLDILSIAWLENYLREYRGTVVVVSHDHYFLNRVATHILDIDYETVKIYKGNYGQFRDAKVLEREQKELGIVRQEKKKEELQVFYERFRQQATKARQAMSRKKQLDKMEDIYIKRSSRIAPRFQFTQRRPSGKQVLRVEELSKGFNGKQVLNRVAFSVARGERVAVIGPNGIGKSTLLKILVGNLDYEDGAVEWGHEVSIGYFAQNHKELVPAGTNPYEWLYSFAPGETIGKIRGILGRMLFSGDDEVRKKTEALSGGEGARLIFSRMILEEPNTLLLDEPTNHLDMESIEALEEALVGYPGTIIFVSHDRHFVQNTATAILELTPSGYCLFKGTYSEYLDYKGDDHLDREAAARQKTPREEKKNGGKGGQKNNGHERRLLKKDLARLESAVPKIEERVNELESMIARINEKLGDAGLYEKGNGKELQTLLAGKKEAECSLEKEIARWEEEHSKIGEVSRMISVMDGD